MNLKSAHSHDFLKRGFVFLFFMILFAGSHAFAQNSWYIGASGDDDTGDGTELSPWATVQKAVDESDPGDQIFLLSNGDPGVIDFPDTGPVTVGLEGLSFTGIPSGGHNPQVEIGNTAVGFTVTADDAVFEHIDFSHGSPSSGRTAIRVSFASGAQIRDNNFGWDTSNQTPVGVHLFGASNADISNNTFTDFENAAVLGDDGANHNLIASNVISSTIAGDGTGGFTYAAIIFGNRVSSSNDHENHIENNTITTNHNGVSILSTASGDPENFVRNNTITADKAAIYAPRTEPHAYFYLNNLTGGIETGNFYSGAFHSKDPVTYTYDSKMWAAYLGNYHTEHNNDDSNDSGLADELYIIEDFSEHVSQHHYALSVPSENFNLVPGLGAFPVPESGDSDVEITASDVPVIKLFDLRMVYGDPIPENTHSIGAFQFTADPALPPAYIEEFRMYYVDKQTSDEVLFGSTSEIDPANGNFSITGAYEMAEGIKTFILYAVPSVRMASETQLSVTYNAMETTMGVSDSPLVAPSSHVEATSFVRFDDASVYLDGENTMGYLQIPDNTYDENSAFTLEFWIMSDFDGSGLILEEYYDGSDALFVHSSDASGSGGGRHILFGIGNNPADGHLVSGTEILDGNWHHVALLHDPAQDLMQLYVDGMLDAENTSATQALDISDLEWYYVGGTDDTPVGRAIEMTLNTMRFWDVMRAPEQIRKDMYRFVDPSEEDLIAEFRMNMLEGSESYISTYDVTNVAFLDFYDDFDIVADAPPKGVFLEGGEGWRLMASPVPGASIGDLLSGTWTQGFDGSAGPGGTTNVIFWDEGDGNDDAASRGFTAPAGSAVEPGAGTGFAVYLFEDDNPGEPGIEGGFPKNLTVNSPHNTDAVTFDLSLTYSQEPGEEEDPMAFDDAADGWNLVGNPFPFSLDWDFAQGWIRENVDLSFYIWDHSEENYKSWNSVTGTLPSGMIVPWQGFWVKANDEGTPVIQVDESTTWYGGTFTKPVATGRQSETDEIRLRLAAESGDRSETILFFHEEASVGKDRFDAYKLRPLSGDPFLLATQVMAERGVGDGGSVYSGDGSSASAGNANSESVGNASTSNGGNGGSENSGDSGLMAGAMDIQSLPWEITEEIPLVVYLEVPESAGTTTLSWDGLKTDHIQVVLSDRETGSQYSLNEAGSLSFSPGGFSHPQETIAVDDAGSGHEVTAHSELHPGLPGHGIVRPQTIRAKYVDNEPRFTILVSPDKSTSIREPELPEAIALHQNYPNPFNPVTQIGYQLPEQSDVRLDVFDLLGRRVATLVDGPVEAGVHEVTFDASQLASGVYIYRLQAGGRVFTRNLTLIK